MYWIFSIYIIVTNESRKNDTSFEDPKIEHFNPGEKLGIASPYLTGKAPLSGAFFSKNSSSLKTFFKQWAIGISFEVYASFLPYLA